MKGLAFQALKTIKFMTNFRTIFILLAIFSAFSGLSACQGSWLGGNSEKMGETINRLGDTPIAKVNNTTIYLSDVESTAIAQGLIEKGVPLPPSDPKFKTILQELIDQRLLALDAMGQSLDQNKETRRRLATARERILGNVRMENHLKDMVNEDSIRRMYDEQTLLAKRGEERRARHIIVETEKDAKAIIAKLEDEADFETLAKESSLDKGSAKKGGDLGFFNRDMLDKDFTRPVFRAKIGDRLDPFETEFGWHIVEVLDRRTTQPPDFETLRPDIINFMTADAIQSLVKDLRAQGNVTLLQDGLSLEAETPDNDDQSESGNE